MPTLVSPPSPARVSLRVRDAALEYMELGYVVVPIQGCGDQPKAPDGAALLRVRQTAKWSVLREKPLSCPEIEVAFLDCWGVAILAVPPVVVVDIDGDVPETHLLPRTSTVRTRRGQHFYFRANDDVAAKKFRTPSGASVEVLASGRNYAIAPPFSDGRSWIQELVVVEELSDFREAAEFFDALELEPQRETSRKAPRPTPQPTHQICPSKSFLYPSAPNEWDALEEDALTGFDSDDQAVARMAASLGIPFVELGRPFRCILHPDERASASLWRTEQGDVLYHDWHCAKHGSEEWLTLPQVRARLAGRTDRLSAQEHAVWRLILLVEAGVIEPVPVSAPPLPAGVRPAVRKVYEAFLKLVGSKWRYSPGEATTFSARFAAALADVSLRHANQAISELIGNGLIRPAGQTMVGRYQTRLYLPGAEARIAPTGDHHG